jgi:Polysaccharide lyase family 4, domain II
VWRAGVVLLIGAGTACGAERQSRAERIAQARRTAVDTSTTTAPYAVVRLDAFGAIEGRVTIAGDPPLDTIVTPIADQRVCGPTVLDGGVVHSGDGLGEALVWLPDIRAGKALPVLRRYQVVNVQCGLEPRVQAVLTGGTLNIRNDDPILHRTRILRAATGETLQLVSENDAGQVVPSERVLARPGVLELRCDRHPWTRAWIAVLPTPYAAVTDPDGAFLIDSVPPGRWHVRVWHPSLGYRDDTVTVTAGGRVAATLALRAP